MTDITTPIEYDDARVLETINQVRERVGWKPLSKIPRGDPTNGCNCVLGRAWAISVGPTSKRVTDDDGRPIAAEEYDKVMFETQHGGPNGKLIEAIAAVCGGTVSFDVAVVPGEHPLMRWMWQFDHHYIPELVWHYAPVPLDMPDLLYTEDFISYDEQYEYAAY